LLALRLLRLLLLLLAVSHRPSLLLTSLLLHRVPLPPMPIAGATHSCGRVC